MGSLIRMSCEILKIIQINEIDEQILTLRNAFHFPFSSLRFLLSLNMETSRKFDRKHLTATVFVRGKVDVYPEFEPRSARFLNITVDSR